MEAFLRTLLPRLVPETCSYDIHVFQGKGDLQAVRQAYPRVSPHIPTRAGYRDPDGIAGTWEAFERILQKHGYFSNGLRKSEAARAVARHIDPAENRSGSFSVFHRTLMAVIPAEAG